VLKGARISNPCVSGAQASLPVSGIQCSQAGSLCPAKFGIRTDWKSVLLSMRHTHDEHETLVFRSPLKSDNLIHQSEGRHHEYT